MLETDVAVNGSLMTPEIAKSKISVQLTKANLLIQSFQSRKDALILNEDEENVEAVRKLLSDKRDAEKIIAEQHKIIKAPYLNAGKSIDNAKNEMLSLLDDAVSGIQSWYNDYCNEQNRKSAEQERKKENELRIMSGIESNVLDFSTKIAACKTREELISVERLINLEKSPSRETKYGEFHHFAISRYDEMLLPVIKEQKNKIEQYENLKQLISKSDNPVIADELKEKAGNLENEILQNSVSVQERALKQSLSPVSEYEEIIPEVISAGSTIICEIVDEKTVYQKHRELLNVNLKMSEAKKLGATLRENGKFDKNGECIYNGIKFKIERKWKV